ncbi:MAG: hypothetical protein MK066_05460 [Crocinitomicaceae bacterium]|nr:hypothetical protein [Crocinitomicaceae bacterium]
MKLRLLSLMSVVVVLSIKAYEINAHELKEKKSTSSFYQPYLSLINGDQFNQTSPVDSLIKFLSETSTVKEQSVGFSGTTPKEYRAFEDLQALATEEELNNFLTHYSPVVRVYAYRALIANEMYIEAEYEETVFKDTTSVNWLSGCLLIESSVQELVSQRFTD